MTTTERQEYPALLSSLEPDQAINVLNDRVALINKINVDIADWLQERRKIEEIYVTALRKLAKRPQQDGAAALGVFQMPWQRIVSGVENMAQSHETFASKIETDVEVPLRQYATKNREMQSMGNVQGNLASIAKDVTNAQKKADKLNAKGGNKADGARTNVDDATQAWDSQAPFVFEQLQALDEGRTNHLRDVLTQLQTHELDQTEKQRASAESCLNALLNVETADEIKTFAARTKEQRGALPRRQDSTSAATGSSRPLSSHVPPIPPPPRHTNHDQRAASIPNESKNAPLPDVPPPKSKMSGLKRLGTVMGRRKSAAPPPPPSAADKEKKREKTRSFAPFRRGDSSRSFQDLESSGRDLTPTVSRDGRAGSRHELETPSERGQLVDARPTSSAVNGTSAAVTTATTESVQPGISQAPSLPPLPTQQPEIQAPVLPQTSTLSPEPASRPDPFALAQVDSAGDDGTRNLMIRDQPIHEDEGEAQLAMSNMANQLRMQAQTAGMSRVQGSVRGRRDVRNTMFFPSNTEVPGLSTTSSAGVLSTPGSGTAAPSSATSVPGSASEVVTPVKRSLGSGTIPEDHAVGSDTQSVHSSHSLTSMAQHPEMHLPGLNASVVETVNTWFGDSGVTRSFVVGELALAYVPSSSTSSTQTQETLRLKNFQILEKCAQNPNFVNPVTNPSGMNSEESAGTYNVNLTPIKRAAPTVAFKYQLHMDEANLARYSPMLLTTAWQIVEGQARAILMYSINPAFQDQLSASTPSEITLKNVALSVNLDIKSEGGGKPSAAMMSPTNGASFKKRAGSVVWKLPELVVKSNQERLLVSFTIENNGLAKKGGVEVKFEMPDVAASKLGIERMGVVEADPFADEGERKSTEGQGKWEEVPTKRMLISGRYCAV